MAAKKNAGKTNTVSEQTRILAESLLEIKPPKQIKLKPDDVVFFKRVIAERANADWSEHDIDVAALLARAIGTLEREERKLMMEGTVRFTKNKFPILNQRVASVKHYASLVLSYRRTLSLQLRGNAEDVGRRKSNAKEIQEFAEDLEDDLIARPN